MQNPLFYFFGLSLILLACFHAVALTFSLYYVYLWFDMPMHVLGGVTIALGYQSAYIFKKYTRALPQTFFATLAAALVLGTAWEVYEYAVGVMTGDIFSLADTLKDITMDTIGGALGFVVAKAIRAL